MDSRRITYAHRSGDTLEHELEALAAVYRFILDRHNEKVAAYGSRPKDAKGRAKDGFRAGPTIP